MKENEIPKWKWIDIGELQKKEVPDEVDRHYQWYYRDD